MSTKNFKVKKQVTRTPLKMVNEVPVYIRVDSDLYDLPAEVTLKQAKGQARPKVIDVTDLQTNMGHSLMMYSVLQSELEKAFGPTGWTGKELQVIKHDVRGSKGYHTFSIAEIEEDEDDIDFETGEMR